MILGRDRRQELGDWKKMEKGNGNEANETYINTLRKKKEGTRNCAKEMEWIKKTEWKARFNITITKQTRNMQC